MKYSIAIAALLACSVYSIHLNRMHDQDLSMTSDKHACDYVDNEGEEIDTSLAI